MISEPEKDSSGKPAPIVLDDDKLTWVCFCMISEPEKDSNGKPEPIVLDDDTVHLGLFPYVLRA